jgi:hypothetical protein
VTQSQLMVSRQRAEAGIMGECEYKPNNRNPTGLPCVRRAQATYNRSTEAFESLYIIEQLLRCVVATKPTFVIVSRTSSSRIP